MPQLWRPANDLGDIEPGIDFRLNICFIPIFSCSFLCLILTEKWILMWLAGSTKCLKETACFFYWVIVVGFFFPIVIELWSLIDICWGIDAFCTVRRLALGVINSGISVVYFLMLWFLLHVIRLRLLNKVSLHNLLTFVQVELWQSIPI